MSIKYSCVMDTPGADFVPGQARAGRKRELPLDVFGGEQQHAIRMGAIAARSPGFLQVVLQ